MPCARLSLRPAVHRKEGSSDGGAAQQFAAAHDGVVQFIGGSAHLGDGGDDNQPVIDARRAVPGDRHCMDRPETVTGGHGGAVADPGVAEHFGAGALHVAQIIGVIDNAGVVGILVIDTHREVMAARRDAAFGGEIGGHQMVFKRHVGDREVAAGGGDCMASHAVLDRPVWSALRSGWASLALGDGPARRLDPAYGPFAAGDGTAAGAAALVELLPDAAESWLLEAEMPNVPAGVAYRIAGLVQMIAETPFAMPDAEGVRDLGEADAPAMRALAQLTAPGPFLAATHRFGGFIGVHDGGRLVAMAGTRMRMPGFVEISGVCTHPDARGRGHAARLSRIVAVRIQAGGSVPILHAYPDRPAAAIYAAMGFRVRRAMTLVVLAAQRPA